VCFIMTSLWEDPGFVMIESAANDTVIISSDCRSGPKEFIDNNRGGYLFRSNDEKNFIDIFNNFMSDSKESLFKKKVFAKKKAINFTRFRHYRAFSNLLN